MATPTKRTQLRDDAASYVRELISAGQVRPGELLRLAPLAEHLAISITPVRESLLLLAQEGWVVQEPHRGFRVAPTRRQDVEDTYLLLEFVSGELAARAAARIDDKLLKHLRELDETVAHLRSPQDDERAQQLNIEVHREIARAADSARLEAAVVDVRRFVPRRFWPIVPGWIEMNRTDHRPIIEALEQRSARQARRTMTTHIRRSADLLLNYLDSISFWSGEGASDDA